MNGGGGKDRSGHEQGLSVAGCWLWHRVHDSCVHLDLGWEVLAHDPQVFACLPSGQVEGVDVGGDVA